MTEIAHQDSTDADIAIIVPKMDEWTAVCRVFGVGKRQADGFFADATQYWVEQLRLPARQDGKLTTLSATEVRAVFVLLNAAGNIASHDATERVLSKFSPILLFLVGTAVGRPENVRLGSVVVATMVFDATQKRIKAGKHQYRVSQWRTPPKIRSDIGRFLSNRQPWADKCRSAVTEFRHIARRELNSSRAVEAWLPNAKWSPVHNGIASSDSLYLDAEARNQLLDIDDQVRCIDMESAGFASSCANATSSPQWVVIRGISDYGTPETKRDPLRTPSVRPAVRFLQSFIEDGLVDAHPQSLRMGLSRKVEPPPDSRFTVFLASEFVAREARLRLGVAVPQGRLGDAVTLGDLEAICVSSGVERAVARSELERIREDYFTEKYKDYDYDDDLRLFVPTWKEEFEYALADLSLDLAEKHICDVGVGTGFAAVQIYRGSGAKVITGVDISREMLAIAVKRFAESSFLETDFKPIANSAEDLAGLQRGSVDVYVSLRTYQSSLLDTAVALREAHRVLRPGGALVISIPNGFVEKVAGEPPRVIRGLLLPGSRVSDRLLPLRLARAIFEKLGALGFVARGMLMARTDVYVWGKKEASAGSNGTGSTTC